jgi:hypothetical protein
MSKEPSCFKSYPSPQAQAENGCDDCKVQVQCFSKYSYRESGVANFYTIMCDKKWFANIQLNGEMTVQSQHDVMRKIVKSLQGESL